VQYRTGWGTEMVEVLDMKVGSVGVTGGVWICFGHVGSWVGGCIRRECVVDEHGWNDV